MEYENGAAWYRSLFPEDVAEAGVLTMDDISKQEKWQKVISGVIPNTGYDMQWYRIRARKCFFFYGPAGNGKNRMAMALAGSLLTRAGYSCYTARSRMLRMASEETLSAWVDELISSTGAEKNSPPIFFLLENPSRSDKERLFLDMLMEELETAGDRYNMVCVVCDTNPGVYRKEWQDFVIPCFFDVPDKKSRLRFLKNENVSRKKKDGTLGARVPFESGLGYDYIADQTKGFSYAQLKELLDVLKFFMKGRSMEEQKNVGDMQKAILSGDFYCDSEDLREYVERIRNDIKELKETPGKANNGDLHALAKAIAGSKQSAASGDEDSASAWDEEFMESDGELDFDDFEEYDREGYLAGKKGSKHELTQKAMDYLDDDL